MRKFQRFMYGLESVLRVITTAFGFALIIDVVLQIFGRYVFVTPIPWTEELSRFLFIGIVTFGAPVAVRANEYVTVDVLIKRVPEKPRNFILSLWDILIACFLLVVAFNAINLIKVGMMQKSPVLKLSYGVAYSTMLICPLLCSAFFALRGVERYIGIAPPVKEEKAAQTAVEDGREDDGACL